MIETKHGGQSGGGAGLTRLGYLVIEKYRAIEAKAHTAAAAELAALAAAASKPSSEQ